MSKSDTKKEEVDSFLRDLEQQLQKQIFDALKEKGLVTVAEQARVTIRINQSAATTMLTSTDWRKVLSSERRWSRTERSFLKQLQKNGNKLLRPPEGYGSGFFTDINRNFGGPRQPYYLSIADYSEAQMCKRLVSRPGRS